MARLKNASYVLALDIGTSVLKAALVDDGGRFAAEKSCRWSYRPLPGVNGGLCLDVELLRGHFETLIRHVLRDVPPRQLAAVIPSAQRLGFVFLNGESKPLFGIPNIDRRAAEFAPEFQGDEYAEYYALSGRWPGAQHLPARWRWLQRHQPDAAASVAKILSLSDWLAFELCGEMASEPTTACESGCLDIGATQWSQSILQREGLPKSLFCGLVEPGDLLGRTTGNAARYGLPEGICVCAGAGDTQLGVLGTGAVLPQSLAVVAGSSAPVNLLTDTLVLDKQHRTITNPYLFRRRYVVEANAMLTGLALDWARDLLFEDPENKGYDRLEELARRQLLRGQPAALVSVAGPSIANARKGNLCKMGLIAFAMSDCNAGRIDRGALALSVFESVVYAIAANAALAQQVCGLEDNPALTIGGGETKFALLLDLLRFVLGRPLYCITGNDLTLLGAAMLAWLRLKRFQTPEEAASMVRKKAHPNPVWLEASPYAPLFGARFAAWKKTFEKYNLRG